MESKISLPLVSICMITYNHERYIESAIQGVLKQKTKYSFEFIIGDDYSNDNTYSICKEYALKYKSIIKLLPSERNIGMISNFIRTLKACSSKYIAICEGDDYWTDPNKLQKQVDFLENNPEYGMIASDISLVNEKGDAIPDNAMVIVQREKRKPEPNFFDLLEINTINTLTTCIRAELIKELVKTAQKNDLWYVYDYWFWLNISVNHKIKLLFDKTAAYRVHSLGASRQSNFFKYRKPLVVSYAIKQYLKTNQEVNKKALIRSVKGLLLNRNFSLTNKLKLLYSLIVHQIASINISRN